MNSIALLGRHDRLFDGFYEPAQQHVPNREYPGQLTLPDNIFRIKQVFISSRQHPVKIKLDEQIIYLKSGDALLVL